MSAPAPAAGRSAGCDEVRVADVVIVGGGLAGLTAALGLAPRRVVLLTKARFGEGGSSVWAQGGIAAAVGGDDSPRLHAVDTLAVAGGLGDPAVVELLTVEGPERIRALLELGVEFDRAADGSLALGREAAHSRRRILHAHGDATGAEVVRGLVTAAARVPEIEVHAETFAADLVVEAGRVVGLAAFTPGGGRVLYLAPAVVLATGGIGRLFASTTNPRESTGDGLAMAARAGARLVDLEFVQFHPTALAIGRDPMPLLTEALRGEGAVLVDGGGRRLMQGVHPDLDLAPRDVVARAVWRVLTEGRRAFLDARAAVGESFPERFPTVFAACRDAGIDPRREPMPVSPAAHYHMGGIAVDTAGRSSLPGLWACGEVASTGVHGANRLASNSLLEALVFGARVAGSIRAEAPAPRRSGAAALGRGPEAATALLAGPEADAAVAELRRLMWERAGLVREEAGLSAALAGVERLAASLPPGRGEAHNLLAVARLVATAARIRRESRGSHFRTDFPETDPAWERHLVITQRAGEAWGALAVEGAPTPAVAAARA